MDYIPGSRSIRDLSAHFLKAAQFGTLLKITGLPDPFHLVESLTTKDCQFIPSSNGLILRCGEWYFDRCEKVARPEPQTDKLFPLSIQEEPHRIDFNGVSVPKDQITSFTSHPFGALILHHDEDMLRVRILVLKRE